MANKGKKKKKEKYFSCADLGVDSFVFEKVGVKSPSHSLQWSESLLRPLTLQRGCLLAPVSNQLDGLVPLLREPGPTEVMKPFAIPGRGRLAVALKS